MREVEWTAAVPPKCATAAENTFPVLDAAAMTSDLTAIPEWSLLLRHDDWSA